MSSPLPTPKPASPVLKHSSAVVIGGGPVGLLTAINLHLRGVHVTVIERNDDYTRIDPPRSYVLRVNWRGRRALRSVPDLYDFVVTDAIVNESFVIHSKNPNGKVKEKRSSHKTPDGMKNALMLRPNMLHRIYQFAQKCEHITFILGATLIDIDFSDDGSMDLSLRLSNNEEKKISSMMVFACDGRNSSTADVVDRAATQIKNKDILSTPQGFGCSEVDCSSTGMKVKSLLMSEDYFRDEPTKSDDIPIDSVVDTLTGTLKGKRGFNIFAFRLSKTVSKSIGGCLGTIVRPDDSDIWKLKNKEEAFQLFQTNFPQFRVKQCVTDHNMQQFITTPPLTLGSVKRRKSLVVNVGRQGEGGIVFLGDAAHSFPPDVGQGVNAGFEDVSVLMCVIDDGSDDEIGKGTSLLEILREYHERREADVDGLVDVIRNTSTMKFGQDKMRSMLVRFNVILRRKLSIIFPGVMHPSMNEQLSLERSYAEIKNRADETTRRLKIAVVSLFVVPLLGYIATALRSMM